MSIKEDVLALALVGVVIAAAVWYAKKKAGELSAAVPAVVKEGAEAFWTLSTAAAGVVADPLDGFGISPSGWPSDPHVPKWNPTAPVYNQDDKVSNSDIGFNFNLF